MYVIPGELPTLNEYIDAERSNWAAAAQIKADYTRMVQRLALVQRWPCIKQYPVHLTLYWYRRDRRTDPDNVAFGIKFILDGLRAAGVLAGDGWRQIYGIEHHFAVDRHEPRVEIEARPAQVLEREAA
jgi:Holliday junction resolvase RusA-like endonuclease